MIARDALVRRLADAYESLRQKTLILEVFQKEKQEGVQDILRLLNTPDTPEVSAMKEEIQSLQTTIRHLRDEIKFLKQNNRATLDLPRREGNFGTVPASPEEMTMRSQSQPVHTDFQRGFHVSSAYGNPDRPFSQAVFGRTPCGTPAPQSSCETLSEYQLTCNAPASDETADLVKNRYSILASLPLPEEVPEDMLSPLSIPAPFTIQEFISNLSGSLKNSLSHYRLFYALTTIWCPDREEHGYFYTPAFKCSTNPRVATAHRWCQADVMARMNKPTECFFNKDGTWYYAGIYLAFRLDDLTAKEWAELSTDTTQAIVKETIAARKNVSPQNVYEVTQLYAAGALKVACVGLQCVGFNNAMYKALLEQAATFSANKWKVASTGILSGTGSGNGASASPSRPAPTWHRVGQILGGLGGLSLEGSGQPPIGDGRGKR